MKYLLTLVFITFLSIACQQRNTQESTIKRIVDKLPITQTQNALINPEGSKIVTRIQTPEGFERVGVQEHSFAHYLRNFSLKPHNSKVHYYDGRVKDNRNIYTAVLDIDVGKKDLQQCADAVMRLRAEHLYQQKKYEQIHFNFTNGFRVDYTEWAKGKRMKVNGNKTNWVQKAAPDNSYPSFRKYMDLIFMYAGTLSLAKELKKVAVADLQIGDVFIQGGSPGHAVIVLDLAENKATGEKLFLLAQSYMPAQEIQLLQNPKNKSLSPWYSLNFGETLYTPEWTFTKNDLKRF